MEKYPRLEAAPASVWMYTTGTLEKETGWMQSSDFGKRYCCPIRMLAYHFTRLEMSETTP